MIGQFIVAFVIKGLGVRDFFAGRWAIKCILVFYYNIFDNSFAFHRYNLCILCYSCSCSILELCHLCLKKVHLKSGPMEKNHFIHLMQNFSTTATFSGSIRVILCHLSAALM